VVYESIRNEYLSIYLLLSFEVLIYYLSIIWTKRMEIQDKTNEVLLSKPLLYVPKMMFLTKGKGLHKDYLTSFELALRDAEIADLNLVSVSSIKPPQCKIVSRQ
jgi:hypothetical protein